MEDSRRWPGGSHQRRASTTSFPDESAAVASSISNARSSPGRRLSWLPPPLARRSTCWRAIPSLSAKSSLDTLFWFRSSHSERGVFFSLRGLPIRAPIWIIRHKSSRVNVLATSAGFQFPAGQARFRRRSVRATGRDTRFRRRVALDSSIRMWAMVASSIPNTWPMIGPSM